jgi:SpoIIAA-like
MAIEVREGVHGRLLVVHVSAKLGTEDYERFVPWVERLIEKHGKLRMLVRMCHFHGWTAGALWKDIQFDLKHFTDIERLALVGDRKWEAGMAVFCKPFATATIRYFDESQADEALEWVKAGLE